MWTCIICEFKFPESEMDMDERTCLECMEEIYGGDDG